MAAETTPDRGQIEAEVKALVASLRLVKPERLQLTTRLAHDLGIAGDDGLELMDAFAERFGVDLTGFDHLRYFGPEGCNPIAGLYCLLFDRDRCRLAPITVGDLVEAAIRKTWHAS